MGLVTVVLKVKHQNIMQTSISTSLFLFWVTDLFVCGKVQETRVFMSKGFPKNTLNNGNSEDLTPRFNFYLYNNGGRIFRSQLSIHEIQIFLLKRSKEIGWRKLSDFIGRKIDAEPILSQVNESPILKTTKIILHRGADKKENISSVTEALPVT